MPADMDSTGPILRNFIVIEGVDGSGTTTQLRSLAGWLSERGVAAWITHEPTDLPSGRLVRSVLRGEVEARPETLARLFAADRYEHLYGREGIVERAGRGELVVCDRYVASSLAYQGQACGPELPARLNEGYPLPELTVFFDIDPEISMRRVDGRGEREIFEELEIQKRVRAAYEAALSGLAARGARVERLDASRPIEELGRAFRALLEPFATGKHH